MGAEAIIKLNVSNVYNDIETFFNQFESEKTVAAYRHNIREYFMFNYGKDINQLTRQDIENMRLSDGTYEKLNRKHADQYQTHLKQKNNGAATINQKMTAIKSLYKTLQAYGYDVDHVVFAVKPVKVNYKSYDVLSVEQVRTMAELALDERFHAKEVHAFIYLAAVTSIRVSALLSVTWNDIRFDQKSGYYTVTASDKNIEIVTRPFEQWLYDKLVEVKGDCGKVFCNLKADKINDTVQRLAKKMGIPEYARITTHSLRKAAPVFELQDSGDLNKAAKQTGHKSIQVLHDHYTDKRTDYGTLAGIRMMKKANHEVFDLVDKDELLILLKETNKTAYDQLALKIQEIVGV